MGFEKKYEVSPTKLLIVWGAAYFFFNLLLRLTFLTWITLANGKFPAGVLPALVKGVLFDAWAGSLLFLGLALVLILNPKRVFQQRWFCVSVYVTALVPFLISIAAAIVEILFFEEFQSRFNFIAVDYLVYTNEVLQNAMQSYPLSLLTVAFLAICTPFTFLIRGLTNRLDTSRYSRISRIKIATAFFALFATLAMINEDMILSSDDFWANEVGKNTLFTLFSAYNRNTIDYKQFYSSLSSEKANFMAHEWLEEESPDRKRNEKTTEDETAINRNIAGDNKKSWNVVVVVMESMSARFMQSYGKEKSITPNLDRLAKDSLFFDKVYATGTRTVRGLEALMLSLPPTPGQSILRRPRSDGIFNLGHVFKTQGYETQFVYGGYAYFDNMKSWFESNGFQIFDRVNIRKNQISFANAWGVCDEDLFDQVIQQAELFHNARKPFFQVVLTTSNHRPYTYPDGRIDVPSHSGREGAVKYADFAIGRFLQSAQSKPWFDNTLFVFVADHNASVSGGTDIPIHDYLIPMIFYNPNLLKAQTISKLASQIDFAPTLLGLLGFSYESRFFGQDLRHARAGRALLGTYQKVSLLEDLKMTVLSPGFSVETVLLNRDGSVASRHKMKAKNADQLSPDAQKAVAIYQSASELFQSGHSKIEYKYPPRKNIRVY